MKYPTKPSSMEPTLSTVLAVGEVGDASEMMFNNINTNW